MHRCYLLQGMIFDNSQIGCCIEIKSDMLMMTIEAHQNYIYLLVLRMRIECVAVSTKVMRKTIWLASMVPSPCLEY